MREDRVASIDNSVQSNYASALEAAPLFMWRTL